MHVVLYHHARLPVRGYGGTERVVVWLTRGLAALGHRVTLLAPRGSRVPEAELIALDPAALRRREFDLAAQLPAAFDILHLHGPRYLPAGVPHVFTLHGNSKPGVTRPANTIYVSADHARRHGASAFVHNGVDPGEFVFRRAKGDYDLFLGRLHGLKGYRWAIEGARASGRRLVLAGGWRPSVRRGVRFVGSVDGAAKAEWLAGARCLWMPARWDEPFGLTAVEAMMSGTPVLGTRRGALPEVITPDVGALGDSVAELAALAHDIGRIDPLACRARAERHFSHRVMAERYLRMYQGFLETGSLPEGVLPPGRAATLDLP
jgi:glycosyltransferase involved in cell wall biosynthesis